MNIKGLLRPENIILCVIVVLAIILVILIIVAVAKKEKFGSLQRRKLISGSSARLQNKVVQDLVSEDESINQATTEGYATVRNNLLFKGQFDHLIATKPKQRQENKNKTVVEEIGDSVRDKISEISENKDVLEPATQDTQYAVDDSNAGEPTVKTNNDVVSGSGNSLESSSPEAFGLSRMYNNFDILRTGSKASEIAQAEDPANQQSSIDMKEFIKKITN